MGPDDERSPGLTVIGVKNGYGQKGPMLVDDAGQPVWFLPLPGVDGRDVNVQDYLDEPVLTWWEGLMGTGYGYGHAVIMDRTYREIARVQMVGGYEADSHEVFITEDDTMFLIERDGDLLISARHTCAVYSLDGATGSVQWRLNGTDSDFAMGPGTTFFRQHDARRSADGTLTLFDNGGPCGEDNRESSRGIALELDIDAMTAQLRREHEHPDGLFSESQASYQELPGGDVTLGWGSIEKYTLMDSRGETLLDATIPPELIVTSYRARRADWSAAPTTNPSAVVVAEEERPPAIHVSWNGATETTAWRVLDNRGAEITTEERSGFETVITGGAMSRHLPLVPGQMLTVEALDAEGTTIGSTTVSAPPAVGRWLPASDMLRQLRAR